MMPFMTFFFSGNDFILDGHKDRDVIRLVSVLFLNTRFYTNSKMILGGISMLIEGIVDAEVYIAILEMLSSHFPGGL